MRLPTRRDPSTVRIWSARALPALPRSSTRTCDGLTRLVLELSGTTVTDRRCRFAASFETTIAGRVFLISAPSPGSKRTQ